MGFLSFWPLAFLLLVPIIILLYILRQETKPKEFSSSMLWSEVVRNMEATKPWEKLKRNILLFLQILTVLLFIIAMMRPWIKGLGKDAVQAILVLDNSASMASLYEEDTTRLEAAKEAACAYVDELPSNASIYVISGNQQAVLELANSNDKLEAKNKINSIEQTMLAGDMSRTLGLVESCASQAEKPDIVFFTDTAFNPGKLNASIDSFYKEAVNASLDSVSYAFREDKLEVLAAVTNYSNQDLQREINLYSVDESGKEVLLDIAGVDIVAGGTESAFFEIALADTAAFPAIKAEINERDALVADNSSWCILNEQAEKQVLILTKSNMFMEKAMDNIAGINVYRTSDESVFDKEQNYDLYIFDGMLPEKLPQKGSMLFINCEKNEIFEATGEAESTRLSLKDCELTTYIADTKIGVNKSYTYDTPSWAKSFIEQSEQKGAAGFYGIYDGRKIATIGFDLHQTDFGLQAEFPILVSNMAGYLLDGSLIEKASCIVGDSIMLHGSTKGSSLLVKDPSGKQSTLVASEVAGSYLQVDTPGIYQVSQDIDGQKISQQFAVLFPSLVESSVESVESTIQNNEAVVNAEIAVGTTDISIYIMVILLILMVIEWIVYVRLL